MSSSAWRTGGGKQGVNDLHGIALVYNWHAKDAVLGADRRAPEDWIDGEHRGDFVPLMRGRAGEEA